MTFGRWISVNEEKPPFRKQVAVRCATRTGVMVTTIAVLDRDGWYLQIADDAEISDPHYWTPLPDPPLGN